MNADLRTTIRTEIDRKRREQLFTTNAIGRTILKPEYQDKTSTPSFDGQVAGISHSSWGYKHYGCRCGTCTDAVRKDNQRRQRSRGKA